MPYARLFPGPRPPSLRPACHRLGRARSISSGLRRPRRHARNPALSAWDESDPAGCLRSARNLVGLARSCSHCPCGGHIARPPKTSECGATVRPYGKGPAPSADAYPWASTLRRGLRKKPPFDGRLPWLQREKDRRQVLRVHRRPSQFFSEVRCSRVRFRWRVVPTERPRPRPRWTGLQQPRFLKRMLWGATRTPRFGKDRTGACVSQTREKRESFPESGTDRYGECVGLDLCHSIV